METKIITKELICKGCGQKYNARGANVLGVEILFGRSFCPACSDIKIEQDEKREALDLKLELENKREHWRATCGIPLRFRAERFDTFQQNRTESLNNAYKDCLDYADKFPLRGGHDYRSLVLYSQGVWGVGKSHLAASVAHQILDRWQGGAGSCPIKYISEPNLFMRIRNTFSRHPQEEYHETEADISRELTSVPLLIIDDMGKEEVSDPRFVQRVLFTIINGRYDNMLPVVVTANLNTDMLERHLGGDRGNSATFDRLTEMTGNMFREIITTSYRDFRNRGGA